jgi:hypothetical protein
MCKTYTSTQGGYMVKVMTKRVELMITPEQWIRLELLAKANTSGNTSEMIRQMIDRVYVKPKKFSFFPPEKKGDK